MFSITFVGQLTPYVWLTKLGVNFALATIITVMLPFGLTFLAVIAPRKITMLIEKYIR